MSNATKKESGKGIAFVISPIGEPDSDIRKRADQILKHVIEPSVTECGYTPLRADKISQPGVITSQIIDHLLGDSLVVADLTGHNPNVFYELAVRHAIRKPVVQIIRKGEKIPFDVSTTRTIEIDHQDLDSVEEARKELVKQIQAAEKNPAKVDSPISMAVDLQTLRQSPDPQRKALADITATIQGLYESIFDIRDTLHTMQIEQLDQRSTGVSRLRNVDVEEIVRRLREHEKIRQRLKTPHQR